MVISGPLPTRRERSGVPPQGFGNAPQPKRPDLSVAARKLGISERTLHDALGVLRLVQKVARKIN
jgi:hypothetical protein